MMVQVFRSMLWQLKNRFLDDRGQDLVEYALVAAMISLSAVAGMKNVATDISMAFSHVATTFNADV